MSAVNPAASEAAAEALWNLKRPQRSWSLAHPVVRDDFIADAVTILMAAYPHIVAEVRAEALGELEGIVRESIATGHLIRAARAEFECDDDNEGGGAA